MAEGKGEHDDLEVAHKSLAQISLLLKFHSSEQVLWPHMMPVGGRNYNPTTCQEEKNQEILVNSTSD